MCLLLEDLNTGDLDLLEFVPLINNTLFFAAPFVAHVGFGKTPLAHILVNIMVKIDAKGMVNFLEFGEGVLRN